MTNQSLLDKAKEQHQARSERVVNALMAAGGGDTGAATGHLVDALSELAAIWREEATAWMTPDDKGQLRRGAKGTAESLRDCATRVMEFVTGLKKHGLPENLEVPGWVAPAECLSDLQAVHDGQMAADQYRAKWPIKVPADQMAEFLRSQHNPGPKDSPAQDAATSTESPAQANGAVQAGISGYLVDEPGSFVTPEEFASLSLVAPRQGGKSDLHRDLQAVHDGNMSVSDFRAEWGQDRIPTDQMVEFLKNRHDAGPKEPSLSAPDAQTVPPINGISPAASPKVSDDPAGDFLRDLGKDPSNGDWAKMVPQSTYIHDLINKAVEKDMLAKMAATEEALRQAGAGEVFMNSGGVLDTSQWRGINRPVVISGTPVGTLVRDPGDPSTWTVSTAPPPPAWTQLPAVEVKALSDDPSTWELPSPDHTSPSQANLAGKCGLRWWLRYRRGAQERPGWSAIGGTAVHACIEAIEQVEAGVTGEGYFPRTNRTNANIRQLWTEQFGRAIAATQKENPDYPIETWSAAKSGKEDRTWWDLDGPEMVHRYLAWRANWVAQGWEIAHTRDGRLAVEIESLSTIKGVPKPVKLVIDQVWFHRQSGQLAIVDIKSGSTAQPDYFQLATYALALTGVLADEYVPHVGTAPKGAFWDARSGQLAPLVRLIERHPDEEVAMRLAAPARMDAAGLYIANVEGGYGGCNSCPLKRACPVGSRAGKGES